MESQQFWSRRIVAGVSAFAVVAEAEVLWAGALANCGISYGISCLMLFTLFFVGLPVVLPLGAAAFAAFAVPGSGKYWAVAAIALFVSLVVFAFVPHAASNMPPCRIDL